MSITIGAFSSSFLLSQPFGYEGSAEEGLTARKWDFNCLLTKAEWASLLSVYDTWYASRINDADTFDSATVGTTVSLSGTGYNQTWTSVLCWFTGPPAASQVGEYVSASFSLVDATQKLAAILAQVEKADIIPALGTVVVGSATLTLLQPMQTFSNVPSIELAATGRDFISGPRRVVNMRLIVGRTNSAGWDAVRTWYSSTVPPTPALTTWYPASEPTAQAENAVEGGVKFVRYTVTLSQRQIQ
jgi:hypothetical protein